jgi:hypothetical protein
MDEYTGEREPDHEDWWCDDCELWHAWHEGCDFDD